MKNPKMPAMHFNTRFIVTSKSWFGGGIDVTPCIKDKKEENFLHSSLKKYVKRIIRIIKNIRNGVISIFF